VNGGWSLWLPLLAHESQKETMASATTPELPVLLDVRQVGAMLGCSPRTVYRLADAGKMPRPRRLGSLVRWSRAEIQEWIADGCKPTRQPSTTGGAR
jgi:excisionase family DNA binding protein